jgi:hypothetical protein
MTVTYAQANTILAFNFGGITQLNISPLYLGLSTTTPTLYGGNITEPTGNYARVSIDNTPTGLAWDTATLGVIKNAIQLSFVESSTEWASSSAPITYIFLASHSTDTGTAVMYYAPLTASRAIPSNTTVYFTVGSLSISLT